MRREVNNNNNNNNNNKYVVTIIIFRLVPIHIFSIFFSLNISN